MFELNKSVPVLVLCPHPDDEIGCGGLISKLVENGNAVHYVYFSDCAESTAALGFDPSILIEEMKKSCATLGIREDRIYGFNFPVRKFPQYRQEILEVLVKLRREISPGLVLTPCSFDLHQDHVTIAAEAIRAFKHSTVLGYEFVWNSLKSDLNLFAQIEPRHLEAKIRSWNCYKTQSSRDYHGAEIFEALAKVRGLMANQKYSEAFEVRRFVL